MADFYIAPSVSPLKMIDLIHGLSFPSVAGRTVGTRTGTGTSTVKSQDVSRGIPDQLNYISQAQQYIDSQKRQAVLNYQNALENEPTSKEEARQEYQSAISNIHAQELGLKIRESMAKEFISTRLPAYEREVSKAWGDYIMEPDDMGRYRPKSRIFPIKDPKSGETHRIAQPLTFGAFVNELYDLRGIYAGVAEGKGLFWETPELEYPTYKGALEGFLKDFSGGIGTSTGITPTEFMGKVALLKETTNIGQIESFKNDLWNILPEEARKEIYNEWYKKVQPVFVDNKLMGGLYLRDEKSKGKKFTEQDIANAPESEKMYYTKIDDKIYKSYTPKELATDWIAKYFDIKKVYEPDYDFPAALQPGSDNEILREPTQIETFYFGLDNSGWSRTYESVLGDRGFKDYLDTKKAQLAARGELAENGSLTADQIISIHDDAIKEGLINNIPEDHLVKEYQQKTLEGMSFISDILPLTQGIFSTLTVLGRKSIAGDFKDFRKRALEPEQEGEFIHPNDIGFVKTGAEYVGVKQMSVNTQQVVNSGATQYFIKPLSQTNIPIRLYGGRVNNTNNIPDGVHFLFPEVVYFGYAERDPDTQEEIPGNNGQSLIAGQYAGWAMVSENGLPLLKAAIPSAGGEWEDVPLGIDKTFKFNARTVLGRNIGIQRITKAKDIGKLVPTISQLDTQHKNQLKDYVEDLLRREEDWYLIWVGIPMEADRTSIRPAFLSNIHRKTVEENATDVILEGLLKQFSDPSIYIFE